MCMHFLNSTWFDKWTKLYLPFLSWLPGFRHQTMSQRSFCCYVMLFLSTTTELLCIHQQPKKHTTLNQTFFIFIPQQYPFKFCFLYIKNEFTRAFILFQCSIKRHEYHEKYSKNIKCMKLMMLQWSKWSNSIPMEQGKRTTSHLWEQWSKLKQKTKSITLFNKKYRELRDNSGYKSSWENSNIKVFMLTCYIVKERKMDKTSKI